MKKRLHGVPGLGIPAVEGEGEAKAAAAEETMETTDSAPQSPTKELSAEAPNEGG